MWRQSGVQQEQSQLSKSLEPPRHIHTVAEHRQAITLPPKNLHLLFGVFTRSPLSCLSKSWAVPHQGKNVFLPPFLFWCISLPYNVQRDNLACSNALLRKDCIVLPAFASHRNVPLPERPCAWPACDKAQAAFLSLFLLAFAFLLPASFVRILICVYNKKWFPHLPFVA